ncbi:alpha/beta fold hydrolase [Verticiella sediminum]|nr:alpha/beta hydrolase [Verticiella sediminum]
MNTPDLLHFTSADGTRLGAQRHGTDGPPLLLVHGTNAQRSHWNPVIPALTRDYRVYALDRRGRGASADGPGPYAIEREFEDIAAVVQALGRDAAVLAHSFGAICALGGCGLAGHAGPLVLYEPPIGYMADLALIERIQAASDAGDLERALGIFLTDVLGLPPVALEVARHWPDWEGRLRVVPTIARELAAVHALGPAPTGLLRDRQAPLDLIVGADSTPPFHAVAQFLAAHLPAVTTHVLAGQKHQAVEMAPRQFLALAQPLLKGRLAP